MSVWSEMRDKSNGNLLEDEVALEKKQKEQDSFSEKEDNKTISVKDQLWVLASSIILSGMVSNENSHHPTDVKISEAKNAAEKIINSILE